MRVTHLDPNGNMYFKAQAISAAGLLGTDVFTQLQEEFYATKHQKMAELKFQHARNNLPPEQGGKLFYPRIATNSWQEHTANTFFFPIYENDRGGPLQVCSTCAARLQSHPLSKGPTIAKKDTQGKMLNLSLSSSTPDGSVTSMKQLKHVNIAFSKYCLSSPFMFSPVPQTSSTSANAPAE